MVEVLKEYRNMLLGIDVTLIIDHKDNLKVDPKSTFIHRSYIAFPIGNI